MSEPSMFRPGTKHDDRPIEAIGGEWCIRPLWPQAKPHRVSFIGGRVGKTFIATRGRREIPYIKTFEDVLRENNILGLTRGELEAIEAWTYPPIHDKPRRDGMFVYCVCGEQCRRDFDHKPAERHVCRWCHKVWIVEYTVRAEVAS